MFLKQKEIQTIGELIGELDDAVSFMETLEDFEDEEGEQRRTSKVDLVDKASKMFNEKFEQRLQDQHQLLQELISEFDDAVDFMSTFEDYARCFGGEGVERYQRKTELMQKINNVFILGGNE